MPDFKKPITSSKVCEGGSQGCNAQGEPGQECIFCGGIIPSNLVVGQSKNLAQLSSGFAQRVGGNLKTSNTKIPPHVIVKALAGTGKTTTLVEGLKLLKGLTPSITPSPQQKAVWDAIGLSRGARSVCFVAFNKSIATELQSRVPSGCDAMTMHSMGFKAVRKQWNVKSDEYRVSNIIAELLGKDIRELRRTSMVLLKATQELVGLCKMNLVHHTEEDITTVSFWEEELSRLAAHYDVETNGSRAAIFDLVPRVLERCMDVAKDMTIDFDDMIWLPVVLGLPVWRYDLLLVDECVPGWTPVMMNNGSSKPIKEVEVGDEVRSYCTKTGRAKNCRVSAVQKIVNQKPLVKVRVRHQHKTAGNRKQNFIVCTTDHKVWTVNRGWVAAGELQIGDVAIIETAAKTTQKGKITQSGRENLTRIHVGNKKGTGANGGQQAGDFNAIKGGNGRGPSEPQRILFEALGEGWEIEYIVKTGDAPQFGRGDKPSHYKIDLANPRCKVAIEIDGNSHRGQAETDQKKEQFLQSAGWTVFRFTNADIGRRLASILDSLSEVNCPMPATVEEVAETYINDLYVYDITVDDCHAFYGNGILVHNCQDLNRCQQALARKAGSRLILCGDPNQCQPTGTLVTKAGRIGNKWHEGTKGERVPIEDIRAGDVLVGYSPKDGANYSNRTVEEVSARPYSGDLIEIETEDGGRSRYTPDHRCYASFGALRDCYCVYLMKRGLQFRIGSCQLNYKASGNGIVHRLRTEGGESAWILEVHSTKREARLREIELSYEYRLPQIVFQNDGAGYILDTEGVIRFWDFVGNNAKEGKAVLDHFKLEWNRPIAVPGEQWQQSFKRPAIFAAANLRDGMEVRTEEGRWVRIKVRRVPYSGVVYSLAVSHDQLYMADGIITHNSIYGFAGADSESMPRLAMELGETAQGCLELPLTVTRRCGRAIVEEARKIVPDFEAHESNSDGLILHALYPYDSTGQKRPVEKTYIPLVQDGDFCVCRTNAPLVSQCFAFIKMDRRANIIGRDIGKGLISTVQKQKATSLPDLVGKLGDWLHAEMEKEQAKRNPSEARIIALGDRYDCLLCFADNATSVDDVIRKIESVFTDDKSRGVGVRFSSIHKSKGLEANRVFMLEPSGSTVPHPMAKSEWQRKQEWNLRYVAITRAINELVFVSAE